MQLVIAAFATGSRDRTPRRCWSVPFACLLLVALLPLAAQGRTNIKTKINPRDGAVMVYILAGEFLMGSNQRDNVKPPHTVYLDGFWIYKYEVTVAQYRKFCKATGHKMPATPPWGWKDSHPIVNVNWNDATAYAKWAEVGLPTEAQWEKSARGTDGRKFPWGNKWDASKCANSTGHSLSSTKPVGSYPQGASPFGAHDMAGNVSEWCSDWYDGKYYTNSPTRNPSGPASGEYRVLRGGSGYAEYNAMFRCCTRDRFSPGSRYGCRGFRCVQGDE